MCFPKNTNTSEKQRSIQAEWTLFSKWISIQRFPPTWLKIWVSHAKGWKLKKPLGIYLLVALLYILQNEQDIWFISYKYADFRLPRCYPTWMHRAKSEEAVSAKPTGNKTAANTRSFKEQRWAAIHPRVALENSRDQKQKNLRPNKPVACIIIIPEFRIKANSKTLQMLR